MLHVEGTPFAEVVTGGFALLLPKQYDVAFCFDRPDLLTKLTAETIYLSGCRPEMDGFRCFDTHHQLSGWTRAEDEPPSCKTNLETILRETLANRVVVLFPRNLTFVRAAIQNQVWMTILTSDESFRRAVIQVALKENALHGLRHPGQA